MKEDDGKLDASTRSKSLHNLCSDRGFLKRKKINTWLEHYLSDFVFLLDRFKYVFIRFEVWLELFMYKISICVVKFNTTRGTNVA